MRCESVVYPNASMVVPQSVLFFGARIGVSPIVSGPNSLIWSKANDADAVSAERPFESRCALAPRDNRQRMPW